MSRKVIYAQGGLGNQLFQYAFYLDLKVENESVCFDISRVVHDSQHKGVGLNSLIGEKFSSIFLVQSVNDLPMLIQDNFIAKILRKILRTLKLNKVSNYLYDYDANLQYHSSVCNDSNVFVGYFQFVDSAIKVKELIELQIREKHNESLTNYRYMYADKLAIHIRRGDFLASVLNKHITFSENELLELIQMNCDKDIVIFSDDIKWCISKFSHINNLMFHNGSSAIDDFLALSQCSSYILLGSTFSWWAAFLFSNSDTLVTCIKGDDIQFLSESSLHKLNWQFL
jgi:hypothetical protein